MNNETQLCSKVQGKTLHYTFFNSLKVQGQAFRFRQRSDTRCATSVRLFWWIEIEWHNTERLWKPSSGFVTHWNYVIIHSIFTSYTLCVFQYCTRNFEPWYWICGWANVAEGVQPVSELGRTNLVNEILGQISGVTRGAPAVGASPTKEPYRAGVIGGKY